MVHIRAAIPDDAAAIRAVNTEAFGRPDEANLIVRLIDAGKQRISLVALDLDAVVGHIFFSPITIHNGDRRIDGIGLAPMAVLPAHQRRGVGSKLVEAGLAECRDRGHRIAVVFGHPEYYPRFDFQRSDQFGISCEFPAPPEVFMVQELVSGALKDVRGVVYYGPEFRQ